MNPTPSKTPLFLLLLLLCCHTATNAQTINLSGKWKAMDAQGNVLPQSITITQNDFLVTLNNGLGGISPGTVNGETISATSWGMRGTIIGGGTRIIWSDQTLWFKDVQDFSQLPKLAGTWWWYLPAGQKDPNHVAIIITQNGNTLTLVDGAKTNTGTLVPALTGGLRVQVSRWPSDGILSPDANSISYTSGIKLVREMDRSNAAAKDPMADFIQCANEGGRCSFTGTKLVRYGVEGHWEDMAATNGVICGVAAFGRDPAENILKQCYVSKAEYNPYGYTYAELKCHKQLQGSVAWRPGLAPAWSDEALHALCKGTSNANQTIDCFTRVIAANPNGQQDAIQQCATTPPPAGRQVDFTYSEALGPDQRQVTPDELDPLDIDIINDPLSTPDMEKVMTWIATKTAANLAPYCYKGSYDRGAGEGVSVCNPPYEQSGPFCYPKCNAGYVANGPVCWKPCPSGYSDIGAFCQKPAPYGRGGGYALWDKEKCGKDNPQGCEPNGVMVYPKCKEGFHAVGCCVCSPDCPEGFSDTGTGCTKPSYGRGLPGDLQCPAGLEQGGLFCYPKCKSGYTGSVTMCTQTCPVAQPFSCGAGCAKGQFDCAFTTANMVISPILMIVSIATFETGSGAEIAEMQAAAKNLGIAANAKKLASAESASRMKTVFNTLKSKATALGTRAETFLGPQNTYNLKTGFSTLKSGGIGANRVRVTLSGTARLYFTYAGEYSNRFSELTSKEINDEIDQHFGPVGAKQVKMAWARQHVALMLQAHGFETAQTVMGMISAFDPTGITGVVSAFMHPVCEVSTPFPTVTVRYKN